MDYKLSMVTLLLLSTLNANVDAIKSTENNDTTKSEKAKFENKTKPKQAPEKPLISYNPTELQDNAD